MNLSQSSAPTLADLDNDGDMDILVGNSGGKLTYYINNGTAQSFNFQFVTNSYMGVNVGNDAAPALGDVDGDNDLDLLVGNRLGQMYFYRNTGSASNPVFTFVTNSYAAINTFQNSAPFIVDINGDTDPDVFCGNSKGGLYYYENWDVFGIEQVSGIIPSGFRLMQNYPNPFNPETKIRFEIPAGFDNTIKLQVFDALGKEIETIIDQKVSAGIYETSWNASGYPSGVYFYRLSYNDQSEVRKMVVLK
jgi:hypothetical protein